MKKRTISMLTAALMLLAALTGCQGGSKNTPSQTAGAGTPDGKAYTEQAFEGNSLPGLLKPMVNTAGELVAATQETDKPLVITTFDTAGKKKATVTTDITDTVSLVALSAKDEVYALASPTGGEQTVHVLDASGKTAKSIAIADLPVRQIRQRATTAAATSTPDASSTPSPTKSANANSGNGRNGGFGGMGGFGGSTPMGLAVAPDGSVLISVLGKGVVQYDAAGKQVRALGAGMMSQMVLDEKGQLLVYSQDQGGTTLKTYDIASGKELASVDVAGISVSALFYDKANKRLAVLSDKDIQLIGADGKPSGVLASFGDYSLGDGTRQISGFAIDGQSSIYVTAASSDSTGGSGGGFRGNFGGGGFMSLGGSSANQIVKLALVDASTVKVKKVITMSALSDSRVLDQLISAFQLANPDYKIELKTYVSEVTGFRRGGGGQTDYTSYIQQFNTDLMSGKGSDIVVLNGLPFYKYIDKGLLADVGQMMTDKKLDTSLYLSNIFDACKVNGKLYTVPASFSFSVLVGKSANMPSGTNPTLAEFLAKAKALPKDTKPFARQGALSIFSNYMQYNYSSLIDTKTHKASFDSPEFIQTLKDFKALIDANPNGQDTQQAPEFAQMMDGSVAYQISSMRTPMDLAMARSVIGDDMTITSMPALTANGINAFSTSLMMGISDSSQNKDMAFEVIKTMLSDSIQSSGRLDGFPVLKSACDKTLADMKTGGTLGTNGNRMVLRMGDKQVEIKPLTDTDISLITNKLSALNSLQSTDSSITKVLSEELPTFFSGQKTAEEVAGLIQNRVNTILNE